MSVSTSDPARGRWLGLAAAAIVLLPYATVTLPFRTALHAQAAGILAIVLALAASGWRSRGALPRDPLPRAVVLGLALYAGAAALGTIVALVKGNSLTFLAGQLLSLALLPLGALAGLAVPSAARWRALRAALPLAAGAAACLHLGYWVLAAWRGMPTQRFFLDNSVSVDGVVLAALTLALAATGEGSTAHAWPAVTLGLIALYLVGSGTRGLWVTAPIAVLLVFVAAGEAPWRGRRGLSIAAVAALALLAPVGWLGSRMLVERPNLLAAAKQGEGWRTTTPRGIHPGRENFHWRTPAKPPTKPKVIAGPLSGLEPGAYRLSAETRAAGTGRGRLTVRCFDAEGRILAQISLSTRAPAPWQQRSAIGSLPAGCQRADLEIGGMGDAEGVWVTRRPRLERLGPEAATGALAQLAYWNERLRGLAAIRSPGEAALNDPSVRLRLSETRTLLGILSAETPATRALGHGLGATFRLNRPLAGDGGEPRNYVHNFYVFLLFKLGWLGTAAVLGALALWIWQAWRATWRAPRGEARRFLAAAAAAWPAYAILAVSSPEILNFRVAPILGLLLAATAAATREAGIRAPEAPHNRATLG